MGGCVAEERAVRGVGGHCVRDGGAVMTAVAAVVAMAAQAMIAQHCRALDLPFDMHSPMPVVVALDPLR